MDPLQVTFVGQGSGVAISDAERPHWLAMASRVGERFNARERAMREVDTDHFEKPGGVDWESDEADCG